MIAPAGVAVVYVPNGLVLLTLFIAGTPIGEILGDYRNVAIHLAVPGHYGTIFALIAWRVVKAEPNRSGIDGWPSRYPPSCW